MPPPRFVYSSRYATAIGDHAFAVEKFALAAGLLRGLGEFVEPAPPSRDDLLLVHTPEWTDKVLSGELGLREQALLELPFSPAISLAHQLAVSGTILACRDALERGVGLHVGGGSHHAFPGHGEGFCVLNDLAVAGEKMLREKRVGRIAVVDLDVHQGNGTAACFKGRREVFAFSMHQGGIYPEVKVPGALDIELPAGTGDDEYLRALEAALPRVQAFKPDLVIYQAGVDCADGDLLGGLKLTPKGLLKRDQLVREAFRRVAVTLGGGYAASAEATAALHAQTLKLFAV